jgi:hypothetical protein
MSVHNPAEFQQRRVVFAKSAADTKIRLFFFRYRALFLRTTVSDLRNSFPKYVSLCKNVHNTCINVVYYFSTRAVECPVPTRRVQFDRSPVGQDETTYWGCGNNVYQLLYSGTNQPFNHPRAGGGGGLHHAVLPPPRAPVSVCRGMPGVRV